MVINKTPLKVTFRGLQIRHSGLDSESRISFRIPAFAGLTSLIHANICTTLRITDAISVGRDPAGKIGALAPLPSFLKRERGFTGFISSRGYAMSHAVGPL